MIYGNIKSEIIQCKACPLSKELDYGCLPQWGIGSKVAKILVVNLRSSQESHLIEKPLEIKYSLLLKKMLNEVSIPETDIFITNLLKCKCPTTPKKAFRTNVTTCKSTWFHKELEALPTIKSIICFGDTTSELLLGEKDYSGIITYLGKAMFVTHSFEEIFRKGKGYMNHATQTLRHVKRYNEETEKTG